MALDYQISQAYNTVSQEHYQDNIRNIHRFIEELEISRASSLFGNLVMKSIGEYICIHSPYNSHELLIDLKEAPDFFYQEKFLRWAVEMCVFIHHSFEIDLPAKKILG